MSYYEGITFQDSYNYPITFNRHGTYQGTFIILKDTGQDTYTGHGKAVWLVEGPSAPILIPKRTLFSGTLSGTRRQYDPSGIAIDISGVSDTLATLYTENTAKLSWQLGSFSIIVLVPVFEAILLKEDMQQAPREKSM